MINWIDEHRVRTGLVVLVIATAAAFPLVTWAPVWVSSLYAVALFLGFIAGIVWFFKNA
jgi:hypothetical protein